MPMVRRSCSRVVRGLLAVAAACVLPWWSAAQAQDGAGDVPLTSGLGQRLATRYIQPATRQLAQETEQLHGRIQEMCALAPADAALPQAQQASAAAFRATVVAWSRVEFLRFGPLVEANRFERMQFWPDPRGVMTRQVQALLAGPASGPLTAQDLQAQSVAVNGLPAIEFVLYRQGGLLDAPDDAQRQAQCHYAAAASAVLQHTAADLAQAWGDAPGRFGHTFGTPSPANPLYRNLQEVAAESVKALATGLQFNGEVKLGPALRDTEWDDSHARRALYWRSGLSLLGIRSAVQGMRQFYEAAGFVYASEEQWRDADLRKDLEQAERLLAAMPDDLPGQMDQDDGRLRLIQVRDLLHGARARVAGTVAPYLGVNIGFNALDGD